MAYYLAREYNDVKIRVWEKNPLPGGLASNFKANGVEIEKFYHHIFKKDYAIQQLIKDLDLSQYLQWSPASTGTYFFNQPYRLSTPLDLLRFNPLPLKDRFRMGWMVLHAKTVKDWRKLDDITAKDYIIKNGGNKVWQVVWEPLFRGKFGKYADQVSAAWLWSKLVDRGGSRDKKGHEYLGYIKGGFGIIFNKIISYLEDSGHEVHLNTGVEKLAFDNSTVTNVKTSMGSYVTDFVVSTQQLPDLVRILPDQFDSLKTNLSKIHFLANVCLVLFLKRSLSDFYWTNINDPEAPFIGIIEQTKWTGTEPYEGQHIAYISSYIEKDDKRFHLSGEKLFEYYYPFIKKMFPSFSSQNVQELFLWKANHAQPIVHKGYRHYLPAIQTSIHNMFICTMAQIYPNDRQVSNGVEQALKTLDVIKNNL